MVFRKQEVMDGNNAAAHVAYAYSEVAAIYPITPSSTMAEVTDEWSHLDRKNVFSQKVNVVQMQSEAGAAGAVHGSLTAGALTTTFTCSQGLLLMIPNLYKMAGEHLPGVFHVAARTVATHALSIFGDHSDIYAVRQTGVAMLASSSVQEVMDLTPVAHLAALKGSMPFLNFFDGFRTSHEIQKVECWDYQTLKSFLDEKDVMAFRKKALNPGHAKLRGSAQNYDTFFQAREASNGYYQRLPEIVEACMNQINEAIGTNYGLFSYYGAVDAEKIIIAMGSVCETIEETVDVLNAMGEKTGVVKVHLYRPFSTKHLREVIPKSVKQIIVLDRTKEPGAVGEPLYLDVVAALKDSIFSDVPIFSGRYGLSSKDTTPSQIREAFRNREKKQFTIGILDDVTHLSLNASEKMHIDAEGMFRAKFWGIGSDGTISATKNTIKIIGNHSNQYVQGYFVYDSKKAGGVTISHLRVGKHPIRSTYLIEKADFVACHVQSYMGRYDMVQELRDQGTFLLNCTWREEELEEKLPGEVKKYIADHQIHFYIINAREISEELELGRKVNTLLQSAFFSLTKIIPTEEAVRYMKEAAKTSYGKKGDKIIQMNYDAIDAGVGKVIEVSVPEKWKQLESKTKNKDFVKSPSFSLERYVTTIQKPILSQKGDSIPVSAFLNYADGCVPSGTSAFERRKIAVEIPMWKPENCIQCNLCSFVCPHSVVRPVALEETECEEIPRNMKRLPMTGIPAMYFAIIVSNVDCTGCGVCANVCPGKKGEKALVMQATAHLTEEELGELQNQFDYGKRHPENTKVLEKFRQSTVKGSQFKRPLFEYPGACPGCGETPYAKILTQLYGERMYIANATGCSSIWANSSPTTAYSANVLGQGPAWSNSLFEDAAEFGYGMLLAQKSIRERLKLEISRIQEDTANDALKGAISYWKETYENGALNGIATDCMVDALEKFGTDEQKKVLEEKNFFSKKSQWILGGDGWAYDIGFSGLDHVLASGQNINIFVFDTELYSNTGGQVSKASPTGTVAKFATGGKLLKKKDLARMAMSYGYVYVAHIAMGADYNQCLNAIIEAESYDGPSLIIAYSTCINQGVKKGLSCSMEEERKAVEVGYWNLFRYNPQNKLEGKREFTLDSKEPTGDYKEFLLGEVRYATLFKQNPKYAEEIIEKSAEEAKARYEYLKKI